jgi:hypothetical protein
MPIRATCPGCNAVLNAPDTTAGKKVKCPKCGAAVTVPSAGAPAKPAAVVEEARKNRPAANSAFDSGKAAPPAKQSTPSRRDDDAEAEVRPAKNDKGAAASGSNEDMVKELPGEQAQEVLDELRPGERILWAGKPVATIFVVRSLPICLISVGIFVMALIFYGESKKGSGGFPVIVPILMAVLGSVFLAAPLFAFKRARRTFYALTNRRALVWEGGYLWGATRTSYDGPKLANMKKRKSWLVGGAGDLVFREEVHVRTTTTRDSRGFSGTSQSVNIVRHGFLAIAAVNEIEKIIKRDIIAKMMRALDDD